MVIPKTKLINCPICGKKDFKVLYKSTLSKKDFSHEVIANDFKNSLSDYTKRGQIVKCNTCHLTYVNPAEDITSFMNAYETVVDDEYLSTEKFRKILSRKHLNAIEQYKKKGKILDIGCFAGFFLETAKQHKWEVSGIEPSLWANEYAKKKGLKIIGKSFESAKLSSNYYDVITMWDVIEHLSDPKAVIKLSYKALKPKGIIAIGTPQVESLVFKLLRGNHPYFIRMHTVLFSPKTLGELLEKNGFKILETYTYGRTYSFNYFLRRIETKFKILKYLRKITKHKFFSEYPITLNIGDEFTIIAKKIA